MKVATSPLNIQKVYEQKMPLKFYVEIVVTAILDLECAILRSTFLIVSEA